MRHSIAALAVLAALLAWDSAKAQMGSMRGTARSSKASAGDDSADEAPARKPRRGKKAEPADEEAAPEARVKRKKGADGKSVIEDYLRERLGVAQKNFDDQKAFGGKVSARWETFFAEIHEDRRRFETSIAKQRLNLFETLTSLGPEFHDQAMADYERMQSTMLRSFETSQKKKMDEFFGRLLEDVKSYGVDQDRRRSELVAASNDAWKDQKTFLSETRAREKEKPKEKAKAKAKAKDEETVEE